MLKENTKATKQNQENDIWTKWEYQQRNRNYKKEPEILVLRNTEILTRRDRQQTWTSRNDDLREW